MIYPKEPYSVKTQKMLKVGEPSDNVSSKRTIFNSLVKANPMTNSPLMKLKN
jgi:hypothetical protein